MPEIITINQDSDTPARVERFPVGKLTYLYDRSTDSRRGGAPGQDFIAFTGGADWLSFAVCDGVSQSFYGDLAARFLGERLTAWLADLELPDGADESAENTSLAFANLVNQSLREWTQAASALVAQKTLSELLPPMVRDALERKREAGSESMFVAGRVDMVRWLLLVCWMGDMRLWLWDADNQPLDLPDAVWETRERWSSKHGAKNGVARVAVIPLERVARITIHSDGVGSRSGELRTLSPVMLDQLAADLRAQPASDDVSILDVTFTPEPLNAPLPAPVMHQPDPDEPTLRWSPVAGAQWYRVQVRYADTWVRTIDTAHPDLILPVDLRGVFNLQVQAMASDRAPGHLSNAVMLDLPLAAPPKPAPSVIIVPPRAPIAKTGEPAIPTHPSREMSIPGEGFFPIRAPFPVFRAGILSLLAVIMALLLSVGWIYLNVGSH